MINHLLPFPLASMSKRPYAMTKWGFGLAKVVFSWCEIYIGTIKVC